MKALSKWIAAVLILAVLILINVVGNFLYWKLDFTEQKMYTLSKGSKAIIDQLEEPVTLKYYFSRSLEELPIWVKNYATRVEDLLRNYESSGGGKIRLEIIDPKPDTQAEQDAVSQGLSGQQVQSGGTIYFGLVAQHADQQQAIPLFTFERESFLEYDISQLIYQVQVTLRPKIGILSELPIFGDYRNMRNMQQMPREYVFVSELRKRYEVQQITGDNIPDDLDVLAVIQPGKLTDTQQYAIDQYILRGKPVLITVDPSCVEQKQSMNQQQMMMMGGNVGSSDLPRLFEKYGIVYDPSSIIGDETFATRMQMGRGLPDLPLVTYLTVDAFPDESAASAQLKTMNFIESGFFSLKPDSGLKLSPLASTSDKSGVISSSLLAYTQPNEVIKHFNADGKVRTIAGIISGKFKTAFPEGKPVAEPKEGEEAAEPEADATPGLTESTGESTVILVADSDFLTDRFSVQVMQLMGYLAVAPINDNQAFVSNAIDLLAGSRDLISLRGKGSSTRPFKRVIAMEQEAQLAYQARIDEREAKLNEVQTELNNLQQQYKDTGALVAPPEVESAIENYRTEEARIRKELREIRKDLRENVESLKLRLTLYNLLITPGLIIILGIVFFINRVNRQKSQRA